MSNHEDHRPLDRDTAELLLSGDPAARHAHARLGAVLAAAAAPTGRTPAGEDAAVAAFAAAQADSARPRRTSMLKTTLAKLLTVKVAAACVALGGAGGVALAASTGALPTPLHQPAHHASADASHSARPHPSGTPSDQPSRPAPPADLLKLCQKWTARPGDERARALDEAEFGNLVKGAGRKDRDRVQHFCDDLRDKPKPSGSASAGAGVSAKPGPRPSGSARPSGSGDSGPRPSDLPSGSPRPSGR